MENINVLKMFGFGAESRKVRWQQLKTGWNTGSGGIKRSLPGGSDSKVSVCNAEDPGLIPGSGRSLEKEMATHSSTLAWRIPWTEEPGRLLSEGSSVLSNSLRPHGFMEFSMGFWNSGHWHGVAKSQTQLSDLTYFYIIQDTTDFPSAVFPIERIYFILPKYIEGF